MKYLIVIITTYAISCTPNQRGIEEITKQYMKDSVVPRFNDPSSYEFVSMKVDTFKGRDYLQNLKTAYSDSSIITKETYDEKQKEITTLSTIPGYTDSILNLEISIKYRGKNKMGALILDNTTLRYWPKENKFMEIQ